jgi:hypothetical protein
MDAGLREKTLFSGFLTLAQDAASSAADVITGGDRFGG